MIAKLVQLREWHRGDSPGDRTAPAPVSAKWRACPWSGLLFHPGRTGASAPLLDSEPSFQAVGVPDPFPTPRASLGSGVCKPSLIRWGTPRPPLGLSCKPVWAAPGPGSISQTCLSFYPPEERDHTFSKSFPASQAHHGLLAHSSDVPWPVQGSSLMGLQDMTRSWWDLQSDSVSAGLGPRPGGLLLSHPFPNWREPH